MKKDSIFITLLKKHTDIDESFINRFFKRFKIGGELDFDLKDKDVAKYLKIKLVTLRKRLSNAYSSKKNYIENVDFIKVKSGKDASKVYMLNYQCFERLAMSGDSDESEVIRSYFIKLREFITENQYLIYQSMQNNNALKKLEGKNMHKNESFLACKLKSLTWIYFFVVDKRKPDIIKIGRSKKIIQRLSNYNCGRIKEVELKYLAIVKNNFLVEKCMKLMLKKNQLVENRKIYEVDPKKLKKVIDLCYCKYVSAKQNNALYEEIAQLLGMYAYTKNKINIKPYIIIDKNN